MKSTLFTDSNVRPLVSYRLLIQSGCARGRVEHARSAHASSERRLLHESRPKTISNPYVSPVPVAVMSVLLR